MTSPTHIITVLTHDRPGIIHQLVTALGDAGVPHLEISQTVVHHAFTIALVLAIPSGQTPTAVRDRLLDALQHKASATVLALDETSAGTDTLHKPQARYILTAIGEGFAGVVRSVSGLVREHGGSFSDFSSQVIDGRLQLLAEVKFAEEASVGELQAALARASDRPELAVRLQHQTLFSATNEIAFRRNAT